MHLNINLPPLSPSLGKGGGRKLEERLRLPLTLFLRRGGEEISERGEAPLLSTHPYL